MSQMRRKRAVLEMGHDAFLDIVANLVGILIILVVVLGSQSTAVIEEINEQLREDSVTDTGQYATDEQLARLSQQAMRAASAQADSNRFEGLIKQYEQQLDVKRQQRAIIMDLLSEAQAAWEDKQQELDRQATEAARRSSEFKLAQEELQKLQGERKRLEDQPESVIAVEHLPTPMAKTVFGDELHFRLKDNRLSVVPIEKLLNEIRSDFERVASSSRNGQMEAAVGPVRGYIARYRMDKNRAMVARGGQVQMATRIQLVGMSVEPLEEPHGQPIQQVLANRSELDIELAGRNPGSTTITVWVYPDSFAAFRQLKEHLYARGFATAARPLPMDHLISGGPDGSRSNAQ
jgi:hypothetical protein